MQFVSTQATIADNRKAENWNESSDSTYKVRRTELFVHHEKWTDILLNNYFYIIYKIYLQVSGT